MQVDYVPLYLSILLKNILTIDSGIRQTSNLLMRSTVAIRLMLNTLRELKRNVRIKKRAHLPYCGGDC